MCGEKESLYKTRKGRFGTSPRVWGKDARCLLAFSPMRNIPTCVGKSSPPARQRRCPTEHPHVCGEKRDMLHITCYSSGTSPRVWGKAKRDVFTDYVNRNIPTCVGKRDLREEDGDGFSEHPHVCGEKKR